MTGLVEPDRQVQPSSTGADTTEGLLASAMGDLARELEGYEDPESTLGAIVAAAVEMIPGAQEGSISVIASRRSVTPHVPTSDFPVQVAAIQQATREGPCLDAVHEQQTVLVDDLAAERRWPEFRPRAVRETGLSSVLTLQLYVQGANLGALNLYSRETHAFGEEAQTIGSVFAAHASIAFAAARKEAQLATAVASRDLIGQAKGILMERYHLSGERAFLVLTRASQSSNRKLYDVAEELVRTRNVAGLGSSPRA